MRYKAKVHHTFNAAFVRTNTKWDMLFDIKKDENSDR